MRHRGGEIFLRGKSSEPLGEFLPASGLKKELAIVSRRVRLVDTGAIKAEREREREGDTNFAKRV